MKERLVIALCALGLFATAAKGQVGVYGKFDYLRYSSGSSSANLTGGGVGIYDDFVKLGPLHLGVDLRGDLVQNSKSDYRDLLGGVRVAVKVPLVSLRPYAQGSIGVGGGKDKGPYAAGIGNVPYNNKLTYEGFVGVDTRVVPHIDWRVIELGFGSQSKLDNDQPKIFVVSTGLVVRF